MIYENIQNVNGDLIVKSGEDYYVLNNITHEPIKRGKLNNQKKFVPFTNVEPIRFSKETTMKYNCLHNPNTPSAGCIYVEVPSAYAKQNIRKDVPAPNELWTGANYPHRFLYDDHF